LNNEKIWEDLYARGDGLHICPSEMVVRLAGRVLGRRTRVLDYSFGAGANLIHLLQSGYEVAGSEVSQSALAFTERRLRELNLSADLRWMAGERIPFADASFDAVLAWHVLYYNDWKSLGSAVAEINRVLRPGGAFLGTMAAPEDASHLNAISMGDCVYRSTAPGQEGATVLIVEKDDLERCFPGKKLTVGSTSWEFDGTGNTMWVIGYRTAASSR
jgi:SAM-dependent methyltransferase